MKNDPRTQFMQLRKKTEKKNQHFNGVWTRDLAIPVRCPNQLSYEATDVGSWSIMCSYVSVKEMNVIGVYERYGRGRGWCGVRARL